MSLMREISLCILDIAENSIDAGASLIEIDVLVNGFGISFSVRDDGKGIEKSLIGECLRRGVSFKGSTGLGLALLKEEAEASGGSFELASEEGLNTTVFASFKGAGIEELGNLGATYAVLVDEDFDVTLTLSVFGKTKKFCSKELKANSSVCKLQASGALRSEREEINKFIRRNGGANQ